MKLITTLKGKAKFVGSHLMVDAYFALRLTLQFYKQEKKLFTKKLKKSFSRYSKQGETDLEPSLDFDEFRNFMRGTFSGKHLGCKELTGIYRLAWNFGNGLVTFQNFLSAAREKRFFIKQLLMESCTCLSQMHMSDKVVEEVDKLNLGDFLFNNLEKMYKKIDALKQVTADVGSEEQQFFLRCMIDICNKSLSFDPRKTFEFQGDIFNLILNAWISILKTLMVKRSAMLDCSKLNNPENLMKSYKLRQFILKFFFVFMKKLDLRLIFEGRKKWVDKRLIKLQRVVKKWILKEAQIYYGEKKAAFLRKRTMKSRDFNT